MDSLYYTGLCLDKGIAGKRNLSAAVRNYTMAAVKVRALCAHVHVHASQCDNHAQGHSAAQTCLASYYYTGLYTTDGVSSSVDPGVEVRRQSTKRKGKVLIRRNLRKAVYWFSRGSLQCLCVSE